MELLRKYRDFKELISSQIIMLKEMHGITDFMLLMTLQGLFNYLVGKKYLLDN